jgi:hypothetical protein
MIQFKVLLALRLPSRGAIPLRCHQNDRATTMHEGARSWLSMS